jgi:hypothetical protein
MGFNGMDIPCSNQMDRTRCTQISFYTIKKQNDIIGYSGIVLSCPFGFANIFRHKTILSITG